MRILIALVLVGALLVHVANSAPVKRWQAEQVAGHVCKRAVLADDWTRAERTCR